MSDTLKSRCAPPPGDRETPKMLRFYTWQQLAFKVLEGHDARAIEREVSYIFGRRRIRYGFEYADDCMYWHFDDNPIPDARRHRIQELLIDKLGPIARQFTWFGSQTTIEVEDATAVGFKIQ